VAEGVADLAEHKTDFRGVGLLWRLAQVGMKRVEKELFAGLDGLAELPELGAAVIQGPSGARLEVSALTPDERGKIHIPFGEVMALEYRLVKL
jgi:hypothetical protein